MCARPARPAYRGGHRAPETCERAVSCRHVHARCERVGRMWGRVTSCVVATAHCIQRKSNIPIVVEPSCWHAVVKQLCPKCVAVKRLLHLSLHALLLRSAAWGHVALSERRLAVSEAPQCPDPLDLTLQDREHVLGRARCSDNSVGAQCYGDYLNFPPYSLQEGKSATGGVTGRIAALTGAETPHLLVARKHLLRFARLGV